VNLRSLYTTPETDLFGPENLIQEESFWFFVLGSLFLAFGLRPLAFDVNGVFSGSPWT
jgi:hypothetical protein